MALSNQKGSLKVEKGSRRGQGDVMRMVQPSTAGFQDGRGARIQEPPEAGKVCINLAC